MIADASGQTQNPSLAAPQLAPTFDAATTLDQALYLKFKRLSAARGELVMPCVPAMLAEHISQVEQLLSALGQQLTPEEQDTLRHLIQARLEEGFAASPFSRLIVRFLPPDPTYGLTSGMRLQVKTQVASIEDKYQGWIAHREGPLFGSHGDAKVMATALELPRESAILDVGAGVGRNSVPLAQQGHVVDAIELTPEFCQILLKETQSQSLAIRVVQSDVLNPRLQLPQNYYQLATISGVISHFRNNQQVEALFSKLCSSLKAGGLLLFNAFLAIEGYEPNEKARQMSQVQWSYFLTRPELRQIIRGLPLEILSDESVFEYERTHLPPEAWPPTSWFINWALGRNVFALKDAPIELRWVLCRVKS